MLVKIIASDGGVLVEGDPTAQSATMRIQSGSAVSCASSSPVVLAHGRQSDTACPQDSRYLHRPKTPIDEQMGQHDRVGVQAQRSSAARSSLTDTP